MRTLAQRHVHVSATKSWLMKQPSTSSLTLRTGCNTKRSLSRLLSRCAIVIVVAPVRRATHHPSRRVRSRPSLSNPSKARDGSILMSVIRHKVRITYSEGHNHQLHLSVSFRKGKRTLALAGSARSAAAGQLTLPGAQDTMQSPGFLHNPSIARS